MTFPSTIVDMGRLALVASAHTRRQAQGSQVPTVPSTHVLYSHTST